MTGDLRPRVVPRQARQSQPLRSSAKKRKTQLHMEMDGKMYGYGRGPIKNEAWRSWSDKSIVKYNICSNV